MKPDTRAILTVAAPPLLTLVVLLLVSEAVIRAVGFAPYLLPTPSRVFAAIVENWRELAASLITTAMAALMGFLAAVLLGVTMGVLLSTSRAIQRALYPYMVFFQTVPVVAVAPLLVIWAGAGMVSVTICALVVAVFPVIANTLTGVLSTDPALRDMFRLYRASWWSTLWRLRLPSAIPDIVTGMRIAAGLAVIGAIVGEFVAGTLQGDAGLGVQVLVAKRVGRTDLVFAAILAASLLGLLMFAAVNLTGHLLLRRWHASER